MITSGQAAAFFDHGEGKVNGVDSLDEVYQRPRDIAGAASDVEYSARFVSDETRENFKDSGRIGGAQAIGFYKTGIFETIGIFRSKVMRFR